MKMSELDIQIPWLKSRINETKTDDDDYHHQGWMSRHLLSTTSCHHKNNLSTCITDTYQISFSFFLSLLQLIFFSSHLFIFLKRSRSKSKPLLWLHTCMHMSTHPLATHRSKCTCTAAPLFLSAKCNEISRRRDHALLPRRRTHTL